MTLHHLLEQLIAEVLVRIGMKKRGSNDNETICGSRGTVIRRGNQ